MRELEFEVGQVVLIPHKYCLGKIVEKRKSSITEYFYVYGIRHRVDIDGLVYTSHFYDSLILCNSLEVAEIIYE